MANAYSLSMTSIALDKVAITVGSRTGDALVKADVIIRKYNSGTSAFENFTAFDLAADPAPTATTATIDPTVDFSQTDIFLIQISDANGKSDRILLDFAEDYTGHDASYSYEMPAETGDYKLTLDKVNGQDFSAVQSAQFRSGNAPDTAHSSITLPKNYLVKYAGSIITATVTLNNAAGDAVEGNYEVSFAADLQ
ncbi:hypothetical protein [Clostridium lundense]|uniref:hypothetical protein n=1 Tax=Clostridium lundense TaxID=319475 RepID=UPI00047F747D|nr:hypothetical protein [Clostridium lundense]